MAEFGGKLYFGATDGIHGQELWVYDPATNAASLAADIVPGGKGSYPEFLPEIGGELSFVAYPGGGRTGELWMYDPATGTAVLTHFDGSMPVTSHTQGIAPCPPT